MGKHLVTAFRQDPIEWAMRVLAYGFAGLLVLAAIAALLASDLASH